MGAEAIKLGSWDTYFVKSLGDIGLNQLITDPTRVTANSSESTTIDMIFTTSSHRVTA